VEFQVKLSGESLRKKILFLIGVCAIISSRLAEIRVFFLIKKIAQYEINNLAGLDQKF